MGDLSDFGKQEAMEKIDDSSSLVKPFEQSFDLGPAEIFPSLRVAIIHFYSLLSHK